MTHEVGDLKEPFICESDGNYFPSLKAEDFPLAPGTPSPRMRSRRIVSSSRSGCNRVNQQFRKWTYVVLSERLHVPEKKHLRLCKRVPNSEFCLDEFYGRYKVCHLKKSVAFWGYVWRKLDRHAPKRRQEHLTHVSLSIVVVYLDLGKLRHPCGIGGDKIGQLPSERLHNRLGRGCETLVYADGMVLDWCMGRKNEELPEKFAPENERHRGEFGFAADDWPGVEACSRMTKVFKSGVKRSKVRGKINGLIMKHASDYVESRRNEDVVKTPRFVHKYTQLVSLYAHYAISKKKGGDLSPPFWQGTIPAHGWLGLSPLPVSAFQPTAGIVSYLAMSHKRSNHYSTLPPFH